MSAPSRPEEPQQSQEWLGIEEAARRLGVSQVELSRMMVSGALTSTASGKVSAQAVSVLAANNAARPRQADES